MPEPKPLCCQQEPSAYSWEQLLSGRDTHDTHVKGERYALVPPLPRPYVSGNFAPGFPDIVGCGFEGMLQNLVLFYIRSASYGSW